MSLRSDAIGIPPFKSELHALKMMFEEKIPSNEKDSARWSMSPREKIILETFKSIEHTYEQTIKSNFLHKVWLPEDVKWIHDKEWLIVKNTLTLFLKTFSHSQLCCVQQKPLTVFKMIPVHLHGSFKDSSLFNSTDVDNEILTYSNRSSASFDFTPLENLAKEKTITETFIDIQDKHEKTIKSDFLRKTWLPEDKEWVHDEEWLIVKDTLTLFLKTLSLNQLYKVKQKPITVFKLIPHNLRLRFNNSSLFDSMNVDDGILASVKDHLTSFKFSPLENLAKEKTMGIIFQKFLKQTHFKEIPSLTIRDEFKSYLRKYNYNELLKFENNIESLLQLLPPKFSLLLNSQTINDLEKKNLDFDSPGKLIKSKSSHSSINTNKDRTPTPAPRVKRNSLQSTTKKETRDVSPMRYKPASSAAKPPDSTEQTKQPHKRDPEPQRVRPRVSSDPSGKSSQLKKTLGSRLDILANNIFFKGNSQILVGITPSSNLKLLTEINPKKLSIASSHFELYGFGHKAEVVEEKRQKPSRSSSLEKYTWTVVKDDSKESDLFSSTSKYNEFFHLIFTKFDPQTSFFHRLVRFIKLQGKLVLTIDLRDRSQMKNSSFNKKSMFVEVRKLTKLITPSIPKLDLDIVTLALDRIYKGGFRVNSNDFRYVEPSVYICEAEKLNEEDLKTRAREIFLCVVKSRIENILRNNKNSMNILCLPTTFVPDLKTKLDFQVQERLHFPSAPNWEECQFKSYFDLVYCSLNEFNYENLFEKLFNVLNTPGALILGFQVTENMMKAATTPPNTYHEDLTFAQVDPEHFAFFSSMLKKLTDAGFDFKYQCIQSYMKPYYILTSRKKRKWGLG